MLIAAARTTAIAASVFTAAVLFGAEGTATTRADFTVNLRPVESPSGGWGVAVDGPGLASVARPEPVELEFWAGPGRITRVVSGYNKVQVDDAGFVGHATLDGPDTSHFTIQDSWRQEGPTVRLVRTIAVKGGSQGGFMSGFQFDLLKPRAWTEAEWFVPGMIYGGFDHLNPAAIGGRASYKPGDFTVRIREDRLPAPLCMAHFVDDTWVAVLDPAPRGDTTAEEAVTLRGIAQVDRRFLFGAIGGQEKYGQLSVGFWFPGSEGEVTYLGNTYPGGQLHEWRRRYHPIEDGFVQRYEVCFRFGREQSFPAGMAAVWRWAWQTLQPKVVPHDIAVARRALVDSLAANVIGKPGRTGIPLSLDAVAPTKAKVDPKALLGFCGKNLEAVDFMLQEAGLDTGARALDLREKAEAIVSSFLQLRMSPPAGGGFNLETGDIVSCRAGLHDTAMYLRSFGDDLKALLRAYFREQAAGREHPEWLRWCREFTDWLLPQQRLDGGFPRSWKFASAEVASDSPNSSFNAVPLLVLMHRATHEQKYLDAAVRAGDFCWRNGQSRGRFVGGTIDNPDVLDKEAATISLEAYLALRDATGDPRWLLCAQGAAHYAETWIYLWNVPMPAEGGATRAWKAEASTVGVQLIATGHSLVDQYMSFDVDEYARLYQLTGDRHYYDVARILLHNTKTMLALPGRTYDLIAPGWQQEHWSMAPRRGVGLHRRWLPWVSTSHLNGIFGLMALDPALFARLCRAEEPDPGFSPR